MKLENLLAPYLYQYKKLNLPGIGTFEADQSTVVPEDNDKHHTPVQGITFKQYSSPEPDNELIEYIKAHTGKMKPLAMADLESYLMLVKQFINIGKPFYIEGIGTLQKVTDGTFKFTPGEYLSTRLDSSAPGSSVDRKIGSDNNPTGNDDHKHTSRKVLLTLATIATIAVIGWSGYYLYRMNTQRKEREEVPVVDTAVTTTPDTPHTAIVHPDSSVLVKDTLATRPKADTPVAQPATVTAASMPAGNYKFVFETTNDKSRALYRYNYLHKFNAAVQLQTQTDSSLFKIYVVLPAAPTDTTRMKDSLNVWYYGKKEMKVRIER